jgi:alpha-mannosidase
VSDPNVAITALKKSEATSDVVVRLRNLSGTPAKNVHIAFAAGIESGGEVDGQERPIGPATIEKGELVTDIGMYTLKAFEVRLAPPSARAAARSSATVVLSLDSDVASTNAQRGDGAFDDRGAALPSEQLPSSIAWNDVSFSLGSAKDGEKNAVACAGQSLELPAGNFDRLYLLAAANEDVRAALDINGTSVPWNVQSWTGMVGQWDRRLWAGDVKGTPKGDITGIVPGFVKRDPIAWFCSHHHTKDGDAIYSYCYLFAYAFDLPKNATTIRLPKDPRIKVLAATVSKSGPQATPAAPLFDTLSDHVQDAPRIIGGNVSLRDATQVSIEPGLYWSEGAIRYTVDGSEPNVFSPVYSGPIDIAGTTTLNAAVVGPDNRHWADGDVEDRHQRHDAAARHQRVGRGTHQEHRARHERAPRSVLRLCGELHAGAGDRDRGRRRRSLDASRAPDARIAA